MKTIERTYEEIEKKVSLTPKQIDFMKHALGIDRMNLNSKKIKPYRNYYKAAKCDEFEWKYLTFWQMNSLIIILKYRSMVKGYYLKFLELKF